MHYKRLSLVCINIDVNPVIFFRERYYIEGNTIQYCIFPIGLDSSFSYFFGQNSIYVFFFGYEREAQSKYEQNNLKVHIQARRINSQNYADRTSS